MWKLTSIYIENIVSFKEAQLNIEQGVATLIFGHNEDNASQPCNGSGKSSLIEAISFALTGEQLRKVKTLDEIINDNADTAFVSLRLENDYNNTSFVIERTISRNAPQSIQCHKYDVEGNEIETDKTVQPTVADYNKFILNEIGLSKDDIYNNYILCDNKYESFFDCSDKNKKEVINRFSNGVMIDESIERVHADMEPISKELETANNKVINIKGSISAIQSELDHIDEKKADAVAQRQERIKHFEEKILECRNTIDENNTKKEKAESRLKLLKDLQDQIAEMEESDISLVEANTKVKEMCQEHELGEITDFEALSDKYKDKLAEQQKHLSELAKKLDDALADVKTRKAEWQKASKQFDADTADVDALQIKDKDKIAQLNKEIEVLDAQLDNLEADIKKRKITQSELESKAQRIKTMLSGTITCPKCGHKFLLDVEQSVDELNKTLSDTEAQVATIQKEIADFNKQFDETDNKAADKSDEVEKINKTIRNRKNELEKKSEAGRLLKVALDNAESQVACIKKEQTEGQTELDRLNGKIEILRNRLFGEITGILEGRVLNGTNYITQIDSTISFTNGQMSQYQQSKRDIENAPETDFSASLNESMNKYQAELSEAEREAEKWQKQYDTLKGQEVNFTMFKSYIARKKIDALSLIVNDFLEKIGSDIRLKLEGFTMTKTGKLRDKISVQVMRDGVDCGSYHKFSGGEKARLNLACILSLHTLTNSNCEDGKGLDFIIIDELLDKSDEVGMTTYCDALNKLKQTSLLITQGGISEGYPHRLLITKRQGISTISK